MDGGSVDFAGDVIDSKLQLLSEKFGSDFVVFAKDMFPKLLGNSYDALLFLLANAAFKMKDDVASFYRLIEPYVELDPVKSVLVFEDVKANELLKDAARHKILGGLSAFELAPKGSSQEHAGIIKALGCDFSSFNVASAPIGLNSFKEFVNGKFDLTFSSWLLHDTSGIDDGVHSNVYRSMELYSVFANLTKLNGYSIHTYGSYLSTLYETFLDFIGFRIVKYFRISSAPYGFAVVLKKYNDKEIKFEEFVYLYRMLQLRNPTRYR